MSNSFPKKFLWGAATSAHQVEGNNSNSDWWAAEKAGSTLPSGKACDHYALFRDDILIAKELGHNAHRFGLEWARLEKTEGIWDNTEWAHYKEVLKELLKHGIEPLVTLNHFTLPKWLSDKGGWEYPEIIPLFGRFAAKAVEELGHHVKFWITINEPQVLAFIGYFQGKWPPYAQSFDKMLLVTKHMLMAHVEAYVMMKEAAALDKRLIQPPSIGLAMSVAAFHPCGKLNVLDGMAASLRNNFQNHAFIRSAINGRAKLYPYINERLKSAGTVDFIGLNYYFREFVHSRFPFWTNPFGWVCSHAHHENAGPRTKMGWEIYPRGLYEVVKSFYPYRLPIIVTENGLSTDNDNDRKDYIKSHLSWLLKAIDEGAPVIGYTHWSLLDNFEWAEGYDQRFGLVGVDFATQKRAIRRSARYYAEIIRTGKIPE
jgi:beta-glucosidase